MAVSFCWRPIEISPYRILDPPSRHACWEPISEELMSISARNHLKGKITDIKLGDIMAQVTVKVGQNLIESVITRQSAEELGLKKGDEVTAVVKATEVMISKE